MTLSLRPLGIDDMPSAARIHRVAFDASFPWIGALHTPQEDLAYWSEHLFATCSIWGAEIDGRLIGVIAFNEDWIEQLYIDPSFQNVGSGTALLKIALESTRALRLWKFQRNERARRFYERHGFVAIEMTDGSANEEKEPDILYRWDRMNTPR